MKARVLLGDANFCVLPIVKSLMSQQYHLSVVGSLLSDPAHNIAHESIDIDYSNVDILLEHIKAFKYDQLVPACNDRSYLSLAYIANEINYPGFDNFETVLTIHQKDKFRKFAEKKGYSIPKVIFEQEGIKKLSFPILVKPIDSFSGKGVNIALNINEFEKYWNEAKSYSKEGKAIAEEFVEGSLYSHSAFIKNRKIVVDFFVNEYCTVYPYQVNSSNISSTLNDDIQIKLREWVELFAEDLQLVDGLIHTQFISDNDKFFLIEIARRCPGDLYSELIHKSTGIDYAYLYTMPFLGLALPDKIEHKWEKNISRHTVSLNKDVIFVASRVNLKDCYIENIPLKYSGEKMKKAPFGKAGIYFIEHKTKKRMEDLTPLLKNYVDLEILSIEKEDIK